MIAQEARIEGQPQVAESAVQADVQGRSLRVCHVAATTEGATWMLEQLRDLRDERGHKTSAVVSGDKGKLVDKLNAAKIPWFAQDFAFCSPSDLRHMPTKIYKLVQLFRKERFDVVQTHLFNSMVIGRIAAWLADVPVRTSMVASPFHLEAVTPRWIDKATCWMDTVLIGSCQYTVDLYKKLGVQDKQLALAFYGPDEEKFSVDATPASGIREEYGWSEETPVVAMVAYFYPPLPVSRWIPKAVHGCAVKGHEDVIGAVPAILREFPDAKILMVGSGWGEAGEKYMEEMRALVREKQLENSVVFTGFRHDVNNILRTANVAVQAALCENLGGTIESLLMECPTVATRVGGLVDTVIDGKTGVVVQPRDSADMARGIIRLLRDPEYAKSLGRAGRQFMLSCFTLKQTVRSLDELYQKKIAEQGRTVKGYRPWVTIFRVLIGSPVFLYLAVRFAVCDYGMFSLSPARIRTRLGIWRMQLQSRIGLMIIYIGVYRLQFRCWRSRKLGWLSGWRNWFGMYRRQIQSWLVKVAARQGVDLRSAASRARSAAQIAADGGRTEPLESDSPSARQQAPGSHKRAA